MNDYKYIIKAEYPNGNSYTEELSNLHAIRQWIGFILNRTDQGEDTPKITVKPVAPDVYTLD